MLIRCLFLKAVERVTNEKKIKDANARFGSDRPNANAKKKTIAPFVKQKP
jgi:hypothetical protein